MNGVQVAFAWLGPFTPLRVPPEYSSLRWIATIDKELERLHGFCDGTWSAPVADRCWRARLVISVVKARERAVDNFVQGTNAWADHLLQSRWSCFSLLMHVVVGCGSTHNKLGLACSSFIIINN